MLRAGAARRVVCPSQAAMARRHEALIPLSHDHRDALALAFRLHHPAPPGPVTPTTPASTPESRRAETLAFFEQRLAPHFAFEEEVLFPALRSSYGEADRETMLVERLCDEHRRLERLRAEIAVAEPGVALDAALRGFADLLEAHVRAEERQLFAAFPGKVPPPVVAGLLGAIQRRRIPADSA